MKLREAINEHKHCLAMQNEEECPVRDCDSCRQDGPPDSFSDRERMRERIEHPEWFDPFD